jgi:hypothetical protein
MEQGTRESLEFGDWSLELFIAHCEWSIPIASKPLCVTLRALRCAPLEPLRLIHRMEIRGIMTIKFFL